MISKIFKNIFILSLIILTFHACANKKKNVIGKNNLYKIGLEYTQVNDLVYSLETKAILNVTYLNVSYSNKYDDEFQNFLVGVYIVNDEGKESKQALENKRYKLTLNNFSKYKKVKISKNSDIYKDIPVKNPYAKYYIVSFKKTKAKILNLEFSHKKFGKVSIKNKAF